MLSRHLPPGRRGRFLFAAGTLAVLGLVLWFAAAALEERRQVERIRTVRDSVGRLRAAADGCRTELARQESAFRRFDARVDSLRNRVQAFEDLDPAGVPEEEYDAYLRAFERYNGAVTDWEERADTLRASESACRAVVERHNALADSLRRLVEALEAG